jgi:hypothetical protein
VQGGSFLGFWGRATLFSPRSGLKFTLYLVWLSRYIGDKTQIVVLKGLMNLKLLRSVPVRAPLALTLPPKNEHDEDSILQLVD